VADEPLVDAAAEGVLIETAEDLYENAPCGYLSTLPDGTIVRVNQTLLDWTGYTRDALLDGRRLQSLLTIGSKIYYETHYAPLIQMQGKAFEIALELVARDRRVIPVLVNAVQKRDESGRPLGNRITVFDASDRRRYERELLVARRRAEQVARDKADLLSMLSHDIRNPLQAVMGVANLLDSGELPESQRRLVRMITSSSESMLTLLNRVLELSKVESSGFALIETPFAIPSLVQEVVAGFAVRAEQKKLPVVSAIDERVPPLVIGDPVALRQVLANLIGNAVKFTEAGAVTVSVSVKEAATDAVCFEFAVADTGIGIPADRLGQIFNEFTQASPDTAARFGGTGLGLAIARKLLALYGSSVQVSSTPGEGSTFSFALRLSVPGKGPGGPSTSSL
jgi:PAS domain S-box-containing protein